MEQLFIKHESYNPNNMVKSSLDSKQSKPRIDEKNPQAGAQSVSYQVTSMQYEYTVKDKDGKECKIVGPLAIEGPELVSKTGITTKLNASGFESASLFTTFNLLDPEVKSFCSLGEKHCGLTEGFWQLIYKWCLDRIWELRGQIPTVQRLPAKEALLGMFAYPIFFARDPSTSEVVSGANPSKYFNLMCYGKSGSASRKETLFKVPISTGEVAGIKQYQTLQWKYLSEVEMVYRPIIKFKQLYIGGGKVTMQFEITSAVVTSAVPVNSTSAQKDTLASYEADSRVHDAIVAQIEVLSRRFRQDSPESPDENKENTEAKGSPHSQPAPSSLPVPQGSTFETTLPSTMQAPRQVSPPHQPVNLSVVSQPSAMPTLTGMLGAGPTLQPVSQ
jgi:hypothetical protein